MRETLAGVLVAVGLSVGCAGAKPAAETGPSVQAETRRLEEREQTLTGLQAVVHVALQNAGTAAVSATSAQYEIVVDGAVAHRGEVALAQAIPAGGNALVEVAVPFRYAGSPAEVAKLAERREPIEYAVRGTIAVGGERVEFARAGAVRAPRLPKMHLASLEAVHSPTSGLTVNASLEVQNPNPFPLPLKGLAWKIEGLGKPLGEGVVARNAVIKPASTTSYEVSIILEPSDLKARQLAVKSALPYVVQGELDLDALKVDLSQSGEARVLRDGD